jgi:hypothetical protein
MELEDFIMERSAVIGGQFSAIKELLGLSEVMVYYGVRLGRNGKYLCPFHDEKTPSLSIKGQYWRCFGCDCGGDIVDFVAKLFGLSLLAAARRLDADFSLGVFSDRVFSVAEPRATQEAAQRRQQDKDMVESFESWLTGALETVTWRLWFLDSIKLLFAPQTIEEDLSDVFCKALMELPFVEHCWQVLVRGNQEGELLEKAYLYNNYRFEVDEVERRRKSGVFAQ